MYNIPRQSASAPGATLEAAWWNCYNPIRNPCPVTSDPEALNRFVASAGAIEFWISKNDPT